MPPSRTEAELLTVDDYRSTPEGSRYQLVEGELIMAPAPNLYHQEIVGRLFRVLAAHVEQHDLGRVFVAPADVYLTEHNVVQPDVLFVAKARERLLAEDGIYGAPDLVVEVVSPSTARLEKTTKRRVYAQAGVDEMWLADPVLRQVHVYRFTQDPAKPACILDEGDTLEIPLLPGVQISLTDVFKR
ncbi:MAG: Uma2 family endonuclease [Opitutaceae bacterium]